MQDNSTFKNVELREEENNLKSDFKEAAQSFKSSFNKTEIQNKLEDIKQTTANLVDKAEEKISTAFTQTKSVVGHLVQDAGEALSYASASFPVLPGVFVQPVGAFNPIINPVEVPSNLNTESTFDSSIDDTTEPQSSQSAFQTLKENAVNLIHKAEEKLSNIMPVGTFNSKKSVLEPPIIEGVTKTQEGFTQPQTSKPTKQLGAFNSPNDAIDLNIDFNAKPILESERNNINIPETEHISKNMKPESEPKPASFMHKTEEAISHAFSQTKDVAGHLIHDVENALAKAYNVTKDAAGNIIHNPSDTFSNALTGAETTLGNAFNTTKGAISNVLGNKSNTLEPPFIEGVTKPIETTNQNQNNIATNQQGALAGLKIGAENLIQKAEETISKALVQTKTAAGHMVQDAESALGGVLAAAKETADKAVHAAGDRFSHVATATKDTASNIVHTTESSLSDAFNTTKDFSGNLLHNAESSLGNAFTATKDTITGAFGTKKTTLEPPFIEGVSQSGDFAGRTSAITNEDEKFKKLFD